MKVQLRTWDLLSAAERKTILNRSQSDIEELLPNVKAICDAVQREQDNAVRRFSREFDKVNLDNLPVAVSESEFERAELTLSETVRAALDYSIENVRRFHLPQLEKARELREIRPGLMAGERSTPIESAGLYVPRGRGSFPSMLYMLAVPAKIAGVANVVVATPPNADGSVDSAVLYAARQCEVDTVVRVGGAQAIAALAYGTESVPAVAKIVGPGSAYVAAAKRIVSGSVDTGLPAGPSESIILADDTADPRIVALDLMIEAEHGSDSSAILVATSAGFAASVAAHIEFLWEEVPEPRKSYLRDVFSGYGGILIFPDNQAALDFVNAFAPEHLLLHTDKPTETLSRIVNAGEILLGPHSAFSLANYAAGANAVLPTGGWARTYSPVSVHDFRKRSTVVQIDRNAYDEMRDHVIALADYEGFYSHAAALRKRDG